MSKVVLNTKGLDKIIAKLNTAGVVKVGVLGDNSRDDGATNAQIGAYHEQEVGSISKKLPRRSFLMMPLTYKRKDLMKTFNSNIVRNKIESADYNGVLKILGASAEGIVDDAFATGGFGKWKKLDDATKKQKVRKGLSDKILQSSVQLRNSITSRVDRK